MTLDYFLTDSLDEKAYGEQNFRFWVQPVVDAMTLLGPETDSDLERLAQRLLGYYAGADINAQEIDGIRHEIVRLRGIAFWGEAMPLGLKYHCLNAVASSREINRAAGYASFQYGVATALQTINFQHDKDQSLIALIQSNAAREQVDLPANKATNPSS